MYVRHHEEASFTCCQCKQGGMIDVDILLDHIRTHKGRHLCSVDNCEFASKDGNAFKTHCEESHPNHQEFECHNCKAIFSNGYQEYINHIAQHKVVQYGCPYCKSDFASKTFLIDHLKKDHPLEQKKVKMVTLTSCKLHKVPPVQEDTENDVADIPTPTPVVKPSTFNCVLCDETFMQQWELGDHLKACKQKQELESKMQEKNVSSLIQQRSAPTHMSSKKKVGKFLLLFNICISNKNTYIE